MPQTKDTLRVLPNPFAYLDHEGLPAATFPFDPLLHSPDRRWVGSEVDRSKTRHLPQPGDLTAAIRDTRPGAAKNAIRRVHVDRAPMKRIHWAHVVDIATPHVLPDTPHYRFGIREGSLIPADVETAMRADPSASFVDPDQALRAAAQKAIADWQQTYGEPPPVADWPPNLRALVDGLEAEAEGDADDPDSPTPAPAAAPGGAS